LSRKLLDLIKKNHVVASVEGMATLPSAFDPETFEGALKKHLDENWHRDSPSGLFFKMDDVFLIRWSLLTAKGETDGIEGFDNSDIDVLLDNINRRIEQLRKIPSGFEDA
jgi:hypothetical protein